MVCTMLGFVIGFFCVWPTHRFLSACLGTCLFLSHEKPDWQPGMHSHEITTLNKMCHVSFSPDDCKHQCLYKTKSTVRLLFYFFICQAYRSSSIIYTEGFIDKETIFRIQCLQYIQYILRYIQRNKVPIHKIKSVQ